MSDNRVRELSCEMTRDLLPLYADEVCCEESRELVEEHLAGCEECKKELEIIRNDIFEQDDVTPAIEKTKFTMKRAMKKTRRKWLLSIVAVLVVMTGGFKAYLVATNSQFVPSIAYGSIMNVGNWFRYRGMEKALLDEDFNKVFDYFYLEDLYNDMKKENIKEYDGEERAVSELSLTEFIDICREKFVAKTEGYIKQGNYIEEVEYVSGEREEGKNTITVCIHYADTQNTLKQFYFLRLEEKDGRFIPKYSGGIEDLSEFDHAFMLQQLLKE